MEENFIGKPFFGEDYKKGYGFYQNLYMKIAVVRGFFVDVPILIIAFYFIPLEMFVDTKLFNNFFYLADGFHFNLDNFRENSDFSDYSIVFIPLINALGVFSLALPVIFSRSVPYCVDIIKGKKFSEIVLLFFGVMVILFLWYVGLFVNSGSGDFLGCDDCAYHNKIFMISYYFYLWMILHWFLNLFLICIRSYFYGRCI